jgi:hypothetical protein
VTGRSKDNSRQNGETRLINNKIKLDEQQQQQQQQQQSRAKASSSCARE